MVVIYHLIYDLDFFGGFEIDSTGGFWGAFADVSAFAFVFLAGLSLTLSFSRTSGNGGPWWKYLRRGTRIFGYGMLITLVLWALDVGFVIFGILHLIGISIILAYPLLRFRLLNLVLGLSVIAVGWYVSAQGLSAAGPAGVALAPLGVAPEGLFMPDYRPLLPWFGVALLGVFSGNLLYGKLLIDRKPPATPMFARPLALLGRHTLFIYLIHQPLLIATLAALGVIAL